MSDAEQMLTADDIKQAHNSPGGDAWLRQMGYGDALDKYLEAVVEGRSWEPNDMSNVPRTPVSSTLEGGMRKTTDVSLPSPDDDAELPPYEEWSHDDLVAECVARDLSTDGSDEDLALRLLEYDESEDAVQVDYAAFKRGELQQILKDRGLLANGSNEEMIARLQEDDRTRASSD